MRDSLNPTSSLDFRGDIDPALSMPQFSTLQLACANVFFRATHTFRDR